MLQNKLRSLKDKWVNFGFTKRFWIIAITIAIILGGIGIVIDHEPLMKEENYTEMYNMVKSMIENKSTDVEFDNSKVNDYIVTHNENGEKTVRIKGEGLEELEIQLTSDYQIKSLTREGYGIIICFWVLYVVVYVILGAAGTAVLFGIYALIKKIVIFFKKK